MNISVTVKSLDEIFNISWRPTTTVGENQTYIVVLDTSVVETAQLYHVLKQNTSDIQCSAYVIAVNGAGESDPSNKVSIPSLPDIRPVTDSLTHQVWKDNGKIRVNISFKVRCYSYIEISV